MRRIPLPAALLRAGQREILAQDVEQAAHPGHVDLDRRPVHRGRWQYEDQLARRRGLRGSQASDVGASVIAPRIRSASPGGR